MNNASTDSEFINLYDHGEFLRAINYLEKHKNTIESFEYNNLIAKLYCELELYNKAISYATEAYNEDRMNLDTARLYAWVLSSSSKDDHEKNSESLEIINYVINEREKIDFTDEELLYDLNTKSHILYRLGNVNEAKKNINKTAFLFPYHHLPRIIQNTYENSTQVVSNKNKKKNYSIIKWILGIIGSVIAGLLLFFITTVLL